MILRKTDTAPNEPTNMNDYHERKLRAHVAILLVLVVDVVDGLLLLIFAPHARMNTREHAFNMKREENVWRRVCKFASIRTHTPRQTDII